MSRIWKCDRCGTNFEHGGATIPGGFLKWLGDNNLDICTGCANQLYVILKDWWKNPQIPFNFDNYKNLDV